MNPRLSTSRLLQRPNPIQSCKLHEQTLSQGDFSEKKKTKILFFLLSPE